MSSFVDSALMDRLLIQSVVDYAIYMLTPDGHVANWNPGAERAKGYQAHEIVGSHYSVFYSQEDKQAGLPARNLEIARQTGRFEAEGWRIRKDGSAFWAHVVIDAIRNDQGEILGFAKITRDRTEEREAQRTRQEQEQRFRWLVQGVTDYAIYMLDRTGHVVNWNEGAQRAKGYQAHEIIGQHFSVFYVPGDRAMGLPQQSLDTALREGRFEAEGVRLRKDGTKFWTSVVIDAIHNDDGDFVGFAKITRDISERRRSELELLDAKNLAEKYSADMAALSQFLQSVIANIPTSVLVQDTNTKRILLANEQAEKLFGTGVAEMIGNVPAECFTPAIADFLAHHGQIDAEKGITSFDESSVQTAKGVRTLRSRRILGRNPSDQVDYALFITEDVTEERATRERMHYMAHHDSLTGLPNRIFFQKSLHDALSAPRQNGDATAIFCIDLDNFKDINDTRGHAVGDKILRAFGSRIRRVLAPRHTLARLGGDEFAIAAVSLSGQGEVEQTAQSLIDAIVAPFLIDNYPITLSISVGVALFPEHHDNAEHLFRYADMALYAAKAKGGGQYLVFRKELNDMAQTRRDVEAELRAALLTDEICMFYQPIIGRGGNTIAGYEALMRWQHPEKGLIMPIDFIPIAEETGIIHELGLLAIKLACQEAVCWNTPQSVAVNLSPVQFKDPDLVDKVAAILAESGLAPNRLELEVTESVLLENTDENIQALRALKALGISIALDDFGTGYSSLAYLRAFRFDRIKIDKSFVQDMGQNREAQSIVRAILGMSRSLDIQVIAEGIETRAQYDQLKVEGCSYFQGYFFGRPSPAQMRLMMPTSADAS